MRKISQNGVVFMWNFQNSIFFLFIFGYGVNGVSERWYHCEETISLLLNLIMKSWKENTILVY